MVMSVLHSISNWLWGAPPTPMTEMRRSRRRAQAKRAIPKVNFESIDSETSDESDEFDAREVVRQENWMLHRRAMTGRSPRVPSSTTRVEHRSTDSFSRVLHDTEPRSSTPFPRAPIMRSEDQPKVEDALLTALTSVMSTLKRLDERLSKLETYNGRSGRSKSTIRCYVCREFGHFARKCPNKTPREECRQSTSSLFKLDPADSEAKGPAEYEKNKPTDDLVDILESRPRWCVGSKVQGLDVEFLVDTRASVSILSSELFESIPRDQRPLLRPCKNLRVANRGLMTLCGKADFVVEMNGQKCIIPLIVANTKNLRGTLGIDFLSQSGCVIDVSRGVLRIGSEDILMDQIDGQGCMRIVLAENLRLGGHQEKVVEGVVECTRQENSDCMGMVEPFRSFAVDTGLEVPKVVVRCQENRVLLTVANFGEKETVVAKGVVLAKWLPIERVDEVVADSPGGNEQSGTAQSGTARLMQHDNSEFPEHLRGMLQDVAELESKQTVPLSDPFEEFKNRVCEPDWKSRQTVIKEAMPSIEMVSVADETRVVDVTLQLSSYEERSCVCGDHSQELLKSGLAVDHIPVSWCVEESTGNAATVLDQGRHRWKMMFQRKWKPHSRRGTDGRVEFRRTGRQWIPPDPWNTTWSSR